MKLKKLSYLVASSMVCVGLTQCTTPQKHTKAVANLPATNNANALLNYPTTRTTADSHDQFISGEYGRPNGAVPVIGNDTYVGYASERLTPNEGVYDYTYGLSLIHI